MRLYPIPVQEAVIHKAPHDVLTLDAASASCTRDFLFTMRRERLARLDRLLFVYVFVRGVVIRAIGALDCVHSEKESLAFFMTTTCISSSGSVIFLEKVTGLIIRRYSSGEHRR